MIDFSDRRFGKLKVLRLFKKIPRWSQYQYDSQKTFCFALGNARGFDDPSEKRWLLVIGRYVIRWERKSHEVYYAGQRRDGILEDGEGRFVGTLYTSSWVSETGAATKFVTEDRAETAALLLVTEESDLLGKLSILDLEEWARQNAKRG